MTIKLGPNNVVKEIVPPLQGDDGLLLNLFAAEGWGTVLYVPFDPTTNQIPPQPLDSWPEKKYGNVIVRYSPNLHRIMLQYYSTTDEKGTYITVIPVLFVDYKTPIRALYAGTSKPADRPLDMQYQDWKSGYMRGRSYKKEDSKKLYCSDYGSPTIGCIPKEVILKAGYWWIAYEARLLELPAGLMIADSDIIKFYYKKPDGIVYKIPGFSSIAEYVYKKKIKEQYSELQQILGAFGMTIYAEPWVEETSDGYVVYMPVKRISGLALPAIPMWLIGLAIISVTIIVSLHYIYKIEAEKTGRFRLYINFLAQSQDAYNSCVAQCGDNEQCIRNCSDAYNKAVNSATQMYSKYGAGIEGTIEELTELLKWVIITMLVINLLPVIMSKAER